MNLSRYYTLQGLSSLIHNSEPSLTLVSGDLVHNVCEESSCSNYVYRLLQVSNGADVIMISREFFVKHLSEALRVKLQRQVAAEAGI